MINQKYGVVYTPDSLADFVASLLCRYLNRNPEETPLILDPASGECSLLRAMRKKYGEKAYYLGIDIDKDAVKRTSDEFDIISNDAIMPRNVKGSTEGYWNKKLHGVDVIIANPPWSSEKVYERKALVQAGYSLILGQYDSYVLFIELAYKLLRAGGIMAFIIPDSLFDAQNENLRRFIAEHTQILVIARLGEKIFEEVNRATTVIVCKKDNPQDDTETACFRLSTDDRKAYLAGKGTLDFFFQKHVHTVKQSRFLNNSSCHFDIDMRTDEEDLINKITSETVSLEKEFIFGRGVEISKSGKIVFCPICGQAQGYSKKHFEEGYKTCIHCNEKIKVKMENTENVIIQSRDNDHNPIFVGENIQRYRIVGECYIRMGINGINYKNEDLYLPPKLLIRKTGLGIYAAIDYSGTLTSQTVYILKYTNINNDIPLEYYLALINSRVVYYYYLKIYGENEWKSHPYLTKQIIFTLPIRPYCGDKMDLEIISLSKEIMKKYDYNTDLQLERLIMKKYGLNEKERILISREMGRLPDLSAINNMKMEA